MRFQFFRYKKKLKVILVLFSFVLLISSGLYMGAQESTSVLNFRTCQDSLKPSILTQPSLIGLRELRASASGRLSASRIEKHFKKLHGDIFVVDVRAEQDRFIKGISAGWLGLRIKKGKILDNLHISSFFEKPKHHFKWLIRRLMNLGSWKTPSLDQFESEREFLENKGYHYYNFSGKRHHVHDDEKVQELVHYFDSLPENAWIHFHCATGRGRSTTFMILYDIYQNSKRVSLEDIILRQHLLGGENIFDIVLRPKGTWSQDSLVKRKKLVEDFYAYMNDSKGYGNSSWIEWRQSL